MTDAGGFIDYYRVLGLPHPSGNVSDTATKNALKNAYHKTLLLNHPDKVSRNDPQAPLLHIKDPNSARYTIDEIVQAYNTLADPILRREYDHQLVTRLSQQGHIQVGHFGEGTHPGAEVYDLEDLIHDEEGSRWTKVCRCGNIPGYVLTESELESESSVGEVFVGCRGCSLFIKVLFSVVEDSGVTT